MAGLKAVLSGLCGVSAIKICVTKGPEYKIRALIEDFHLKKIGSKLDQVNLLLSSI